MWPKRADRPLVIGHRGASALVTENTVPAFERALADGADGVELDVHLCATGEVIVHHDFDLARLAGDVSRVSDLSLAEIAQRELVGGYRIPTLEQVFEALPDTALVNVELKSPGFGRARSLARAVARSVKRCRNREILFSSFDPVALLILRILIPERPRGLLFHSGQRLPGRRGWCAPLVAADAVHPEACLVDEATMETWRREGRRVHTWTVDEPAELVRLARLGVDAVICNDPRAAVDKLTNR